MDATLFVTQFPEFSNTTTYPVTQINFWLGVGGKLLGNTRWVAAELLDEGLALFTAHHLVLYKQNAASAASGATPGGNTGAVSNKSVDKVSVGYDTTASVEENAGHWNLSTYGLQFIALTRMVGAGGVQL